LDNSVGPNKTEYASQAFSVKKLAYFNSKPVNDGELKYVILSNLYGTIENAFAMLMFVKYNINFMKKKNFFITFIQIYKFKQKLIKYNKYENNC
jgi:hypothetical protein